MRVQIMEGPAGECVLFGRTRRGNQDNGYAPKDELLKMVDAFSQGNAYLQFN